MSSCTNRWAGVALCAVALLAANALAGDRSQNSRNDANPWTAAEAVEAGKLAGELIPATTPRPTILYVGFSSLFDGGHIAGASFHGTASTAKGMADLKKWAAAIPRTTDLVIYCGCCPFGYCPNIRPAFVALHAMGFSRLRVLVMPNNLASDWIEKGYPIEKGH